MRLGRAAALGALLLLHSSQASADWLITPFVGMAFAGETSFLLLGRGAGESKLTFGGSVVLLSDSLLGLEADVAHSPGFFKKDDDPLGLVTASRVTTLGGNLIVAAPLTVTRESLRPYLVGGLGVMQARADDIISLEPVDKDLLALTIGGGAIGLLSERTGVRFDLRHLKAITGEDGPFAAEGTSRLSFWRASVGVILRY
jgi:hypothetical protein